MTTKNIKGFTLIEMLVVISIIAVLAAFAVPAVMQGLTKGQMVGTMNNARQMFLAGQQMALDGAANSDPNYGWPGDLSTSTAGAGGAAATTTPMATLQEYCTRLVQNDYLKGGDLQKLLNAPGASCTVTAADDGTITLAGKPALKVYKVKETDGSNTIFAVTANYVYDTALTTTAAPYGDKGFVVMRKGGDAGNYRKNQATTANYSTPRAFQSAIGKLPEAVDGTVVAGDNDKNLTNPTQ
jgi:prepilin-type N-terminal cleavage/methylation domain-containing protein